MNNNFTSLNKLEKIEKEEARMLEIEFEESRERARKEESVSNLDILLGFCRQIEIAIREGSKDRVLYLLRHMEDFLKEKPVL